jgi:hypothetical protein
VIKTLKTAPRPPPQHQEYIDLLKEVGSPPWSTHFCLPCRRLLGLCSCPAGVCSLKHWR